MQTQLRMSAHGALRCDCLNRCWHEPVCIFCACLCDTVCKLIVHPPGCYGVSSVHGDTRRQGSPWSVWSRENGFRRACSWTGMWHSAAVDRVCHKQSVFAACSKQVMMQYGNDSVNRLSQAAQFASRCVIPSFVKCRESGGC